MGKNILGKNKSGINQLKAGAILSYLSMGLNYIISIAYTPIMLRLLGQSEYGLYNLVASVVSYLGLLNFGLNSAYVRYYSQYKVRSEQENIKKLNGMFLIVFSIIGLIAIFAGTILTSNIRAIFGEKLTISELSKAQILMAIMVFNLALSFPATVFNSYVTANERYVFQKSLQMIKTIVNPFIILPILLMGYKSVGMVIATTILNVTIEITTAIYCFKRLDMGFLFQNFDFLLMKEMTIFSFYIFLNMIIDQINWNVDKFLLGRFRGTISVAIYGLAAQINRYYLSLSTAISSVFVPRINRMVATANNNNNELTALFTRVGRIQFILLSLICTGFIFLGKPFINMWAGSSYTEAYFIVIILMLSETVPLIQNIGIEIQRAKNMHKFRSIVYFFIAIGNLFISIPLSKLYGGIGAAIGTAIAQIIGTNIIMNIYYHYRVGINIKYFWSQIIRFIPSLILPVITGLIIQLFELSNITMFLCVGFVYVIIFSGSMWLFGMNQYEKDLVLTPLTKVKSLIKKR